MCVCVCGIWCSRWCQLFFEAVNKCKAAEKKQKQIIQKKARYIYRKFRIQIKNKELLKSRSQDVREKKREDVAYRKEAYEYLPWHVCIYYTECIEREEKIVQKENSLATYFCCDFLFIRLAIRRRRGTKKIDGQKCKKKKKKKGDIRK